MIDHQSKLIADNSTELSRILKNLRADKEIQKKKKGKVKRQTLTKNERKLVFEKKEGYHILKKIII